MSSGSYITFALPHTQLRSIQRVLKGHSVNCFAWVILSRLNPWYKDRERAARLNLEANNIAEVVGTVAR